MIKTSFAKTPERSIKGGVLAIAIFEGGKLSTSAKAIDKACGGAITQAIACDNFTGKQGEVLSLPAVKAKAPWQADRFVLFGCGKSPLDDNFFRTLGAKLYKIASKTPATALHIVANDIASSAEQACLIAYGAEFCSYDFTKYLSKSKLENRGNIKSISVYCKKPSAKLYKNYQALVQGSNFTRDLVSEPPNELYPQKFANLCKPLSKHGLKITVLDEKKLKKLGFRTLLGVGQGSERESHVVIMQWFGAKNKKQAPLAFIGKGVTFDTGGISLKPPPGMEEMKWDMAGAAVVSGLMKTLALRKAPVNAVGIIGLVENMPDGNAQRPGDIVKSYAGKTVEIHNTDAEGRLVLADLLAYCEKQYKPKSMINLATLTGAIVVALGHEHAGLFSNNDDLAQQLTEAGNISGEKLWRMPLHKKYDQLLDTSHADMKNIGGRTAGSITAAQFLQRFVDKCAWAHLDIAGVAWWNKEEAMGRTGASGFGVALLDEWVKKRQ